MEILLLLVGAWALSPIVLGLALLASRKRRQRAEAAAAKHDAAAARAVRGIGELPPRDVASLLLLQLELGRQRDAGTLEDGEHRALADAIDAVWTGALAHDALHADTGKWHRRRDEAWSVLARTMATPPGPPPWRAQAAPEPGPVTSHEGAEAGEAALADDLDFTLDARPEPAPSAPGTDVPEAPAALPETTEPEPIAPWRPDDWQPDSLAARAATVAPLMPPAGDVAVPAPAAAEAVPDEPGDASAFAFEPAEPGPLARAVETVSGWPRLAAPFLVQNVGWFVGGFCFVAGTLFLVSVTTGFANALVILTSLAAYTGFLAWAGYAIRRKSPELRTSSNVLLSIAMLLMPLNLTAGVHLVSAAGGSMAALALAIGLVLGQGAGILVVARLVNALVDRALPARHATLFTALAAVQITAPVVHVTGHWLALAAAHAAVLALLAYGLVAFARDWVRSVFLDRRAVAYYSAGLLVFAALVSFVQVARAYPAPLPAGYLGPYLMALAAMLLYVDTTLKEWVSRYPYLSRFTFAVYGLSIAALALCFDAPVPRTVALVLAVATYGQVLWRYTSVPALYLLLAALAWLYGSLVLGPLPPGLHLLASVPGLAGLLALTLWAERRSAALATVCVRALDLAAAGLTVWTLAQSEPGPIAFASGALATAALAWALARAPWVLRAGFAGGGSVPAGGHGPWTYAAVALAAVTLAYAPVLPGASWHGQLGFTLLALAAGSARLGLRRFAGACLARTEAAVNCALVLSAAAVAAGAWDAAARFPQAPALAVLLGLTACLLAWLSVELRAGWLFYGVLAAVGVAALVVKRTWFPAPSFGTGELVGVAALWLIVWWLDRRHAAARSTADEDEARTPVRILWTPPARGADAIASGGPRP